MFGYIRPHKAELLVKEHEQYKALYCALCRQLGESYGIPSRFSLSFDATFFAMALIGLRENGPEFEPGKCVVNPARKCLFCTNGGEELRVSAALCVIMAYQKLRDDIADDRLWKQSRASLALPFAAHARKKAAEDYPELDRILSLTMMEQTAVEQERGESIDFYADPTAKMLQQAFSWAVGAAEMSPQDRVVRQVGYLLGRWVYIIDAADDVEKDWKDRAFNPFLIRCAIPEDAPPDAEKVSEIRKEANLILNATVSQLVASVNMLAFSHFGTIIHNIVEQGLPLVQMQTLFEREKKNDDRSL